MKITGILPAEGWLQLLIAVKHHCSIAINRRFVQNATKQA
jgi:hypothetical protein